MANTMVVKRHGSIAEYQRHYTREVDELAEEARLKYITPGNGQSMTYSEKYQEALHGDGPFLRAEAEALGLTVEQVAATVIAARDQWKLVGPRIEAARLKAKQLIFSSATPADMHAAKEQFLSQL